MRTGLLVTAVAGITAVTAAAGYGAGRLTLTDQPADLGETTPLVSVTIPVPSTTPTLPPPLPDPAGPALSVDRFKGRDFHSVLEPPRTLYVDVPHDWTELLDLSTDHLEIKFRVPQDKTYWLRVEAARDKPDNDQARDDRRGELQRNGTRDLRITGTPSGTVRSRLDDTQRRYEGLDYTFTEQGRRHLVVLVRWVEGVEISVAGRERDRAGMEEVLERAMQSVRLVED